MYRAEVIGSMLRPSYLQEARAALQEGTLSAHDFKRVEDRAVDQVIAMQEGAGVDVVSDGEMRRFLFMARSPRPSRASSRSTTTARCRGARRRATSSGCRRWP
jgi:hypothetical protein